MITTRTDLNHNLLTAEQERTLLGALPDPAARDELVRCNQRLVASIAARYLGAGMDLEDMLQEGNIGLLRAIQKWDPVRGRGVRFASYATWWIRQAITRALILQGHAGIRLSVHSSVQQSALRRAEMAVSRNREPITRETLAAATGIRPARVDELRSLPAVVCSLDEPWGETGAETLGERLLGQPTDHDPDRWFLRLTIAQALSQLTPRDRQIVQRYLGLDGGPAATFQEIGNQLGVTRERARQLFKKAIAHLQLPHIREQFAGWQ